MKRILIVPTILIAVVVALEGCKTNDDSSMKSSNTMPIKSIVCTSENPMIFFRATRTNDLSTSLKLLEFRYEKGDDGATQSGLFHKEQQLPNGSFQLSDEKPPVKLTLTKREVKEGKSNYLGELTGVFRDPSVTALVNAPLSCEVVLGTF